MIGPISLITLIILGGAMLWSVRLLYEPRGAWSDDPLRLLLTLWAWLLIFFGAIGVIIGATGPFAVYVLVVFIYAVIQMTMLGYSKEYRSMLYMLALAAERGIPLAEAARSLASERGDDIGNLALRLSNLLEAGLPLDAALARVRVNRLLTLSSSSEITLALRTGRQYGQFGPPLREAIERSERLKQSLASIAAKIAYMMIVVMSLYFAVMYVQIRILPTIGYMMAEYDIELTPAIDLFTSPSSLMLSLIVAVGAIVALAFVAVLGYWLLLLSGLASGMPFIGRRHSHDFAAVMRNLSFAVRQNRSLAETVQMLGTQYPRFITRNRLRRASQQIEAGAPWCEALQAVGLMRPSDAAILGAAQRAGNLAWALDELADSRQRRLLYRAQNVFSIVSPIFFIAVGAVVCFMAATLFVPLATLIQELAVPL